MITKKIIITIASTVTILTLSTGATVFILNNNKNKNIKEETTTTTQIQTDFTKTTEKTTVIEEKTTTQTVEDNINNITINDNSKPTTTTTAPSVMTPKNSNEPPRQTTTRIVNEETVVRKDDKYHVTQIITYLDTYKVYENNSKELINRIQKSSSYDYSTFNATTAELRAEASSISASNTSVYQEMLGYVNELRATEGADPVTLDSSLSLAATVRALEIAWSGKISHTRPNGTRCFTVLEDLGIAVNAAGENIAGYNPNAKHTFNQWYNSEGHHKNMVDKDFTRLGVGKVTLNGQTHWVQMFAG